MPSRWPTNQQIYDRLMDGDRRQQLVAREFASLVDWKGITKPAGIRFVNHQIVREGHPTIGHAIVAALNDYGPTMHVAGIVYHPPDPNCTWLEDRGEMAEIIMEIRS